LKGAPVKGLVFNDIHRQWRRCQALECGLSFAQDGQIMALMDCIIVLLKFFDKGFLFVEETGQNSMIIT